MKDLSAMLWAWAGVCALSVLAAAVMALAWAHVEEEELARAHVNPGKGVSVEAQHSVHPPAGRVESRPPIQHAAQAE